MPYCPVCKAEYEEGVLHCKDCRVSLLPGAPPVAVEPLRRRLARQWRSIRLLLGIQTPHLLAFTPDAVLSRRESIIPVVIAGYWSLCSGIAAGHSVSGWWSAGRGSEGHPWLAGIGLAISSASLAWWVIFPAILSGVLWGSRRLGYAVLCFLLGMIESAFSMSGWHIPTAEYWQELQGTSVTAWLVRAMTLGAFCIFFGWLPRWAKGEFKHELATYAVIRGTIGLLLFLVQEPRYALLPGANWAISVQMALAVVLPWLHRCVIAVALGYCIGGRWRLWMLICVAFAVLGGWARGSESLAYYHATASAPHRPPLGAGMVVALSLYPVLYGIAYAVLIAVGHVLAVGRQKPPAVAQELAALAPMGQD